jgi:hypothetical protein
MIELIPFLYSQDGDHLICLRCEDYETGEKSHLILSITFLWDGKSVKRVMEHPETMWQITKV